LCPSPEGQTSRFLFLYAASVLEKSQQKSPPMKFLSTWQFRSRYDAAVKADLGRISLRLVETRKDESLYLGRS